MALFADSKTPYIDMYNNYRNEQQNIRDAYRKQLEADRTAAEASSNAEYDNAARQNYINYMQARKSLPSQLNALGIRGGASESSALRLGTNYGSNVASNEASRNAALAALRQQYEDKLASYDEEWDNKLQQAYLTAIENQLRWEQEQKALSSGGGGGSSRRSYGGYGSSGSSSGSTSGSTSGASKGILTQIAEDALKASKKKTSSTVASAIRTGSNAVGNTVRRRNSLR